jgi:uncharacterized protein YggE
MRRIFSFLLIAVPLAAQDVREVKGPPSIRVNGEATEKAQPDHAQIDIGVTTQAKTAEAASAENAQKATAVMDQLKSAAPSAQIKTVNYSVNPNYEYSKTGGTPTITGYTVNNTVRVDLTDLKLVQKVVDTATRSGANQINRLDFDLKNDKEARGKALAAAVSQARGNAQALAEALGVKIGKILEVQQGDAGGVPPPRPMAMMRGAAAKAADETPVSPGELDIHASVSVIFEIIQ